MASFALTDHFIPLLSDVEDLGEAYDELMPGVLGRANRLIPLNRAVVVVCVSAWEAYVEELVKEAVRALRPVGPTLGPWPAINAATRAAVGRFNTPNTDQVRLLISDAIGLPDVQLSWVWSACNAVEARTRLQEAMDLRHAVAHGLNPRPVVSYRYAGTLYEFVREHARCTDAAVRDYLVTVLGVANPWPP